MDTYHVFCVDDGGVPVPVPVLVTVVAPVPEGVVAGGGAGLELMEEDREVLDGEGCIEGGVMLDEEDVIGGAGMLEEDD